MPIVKLVVIGSSGVGKTSLRGKYIEGRFSNGYRATIGADFITKTLSHPTNPEQSVTLQIWDTAGQERFSSLSTAFFRGADAALLMFDVNTPETMQALKKWWKDFCDRAPLEDEAVNDYCCVVVGNKIDMLGKTGSVVSESEALKFLDELVPPAGSSTSDIIVLPPSISNGSPEILQQNLVVSSSISSSANSSTSQLAPFPSSGSDTRTASIAIGSHLNSPPALGGHSPKHHLSKSRSHSSSRFYAGTMTTPHTTLTIYHTPSSSVYDVYQSARSSPEPWAVPSTASPPTHRQRTMTMLSTGSTSSGSAATITPSLFAREAEQRNGSATSASSSASASASAATSPQIPSALSSETSPLPPDRGPKLFFTSAKTGEGVKDVFEYIARRVVQKWDYEEWVEARTMHFREASANSGVGTDGNTIRLQREMSLRGKKLGDCCAL